MYVLFKRSQTCLRYEIKCMDGVFKVIIEIKIFVLSCL